MKLLMDCDPGVDDAVALLMALRSPGLDLLGVTTVFGNAPLATCTRNARTILRHGGRPDLPLGGGAEGPLVGRFHGGAAVVHGRDGLGDGGVERSPEDDRPADLPALDLLAREALAHPGEVTLLAVGPLTNVALLARARPDAARALKAVVVMGGAALAPGNVTPAAEANIFNDPEAAEIVFGFPWDVTMIGLDVTERVILGPDHLARMAAASDLLSRAVPFYRAFYKRWDGIDGLMAHDAAALSYLLAPQLFETRVMPLRVELAGLGRGKTWVVSRRNDMPAADFKGRPPVLVALGVDGPAVAGLIAGSL